MPQFRKILMWDNPIETLNWMGGSMLVLQLLHGTNFGKVMTHGLSYFLVFNAFVECCTTTQNSSSGWVSQFEEPYLVNTTFSLFQPILKILNDLILSKEPFSTLAAGVIVFVIHKLAMAVSPLNLLTIVDLSLFILPRLYLKHRGALFSLMYVYLYSVEQHLPKKLGKLISKDDNSIDNISDNKADEQEMWNSDNELPESETEDEYTIIPMKHDANYFTTRGDSIPRYLNNHKNPYNVLDVEEMTPIPHSSSTVYIESR